MFNIATMSYAERLHNGLSSDMWHDNRFKIVRDDGKVVDTCLTMEQALSEIEAYDIIECEISLERCCDD